MKTMWILCLTSFLLLGGCSQDLSEPEDTRTDVDAPNFSGGTFIWENQSGHDIRMVARITADGEEVVEFDCALRGLGFFSYTILGGGGYPMIEYVWWSSLEVWYDGKIKVPYTPKPHPEGGAHPTIEAPADYPKSHDLMSTENYIRVKSVDEFSATHYTYTYTFTDADYEAAKAWSESQQ